MKSIPPTLQGVFLLVLTTSGLLAQESTNQNNSNSLQNQVVAEENKKNPLIIQTIDKLGTEPTRKEVGSAIFGLVKIKPDCALDIVHYAVKTLPAKYAPEIIASATSALPNPWKEIVYPPGPRCPEMIAYYATQTASNGEKKQNAPSTMLLIEALVYEALNARPELSLTDVQGAAEASLKGNPDLMLNSTFDPRVTIGVGIVGNANYSNEPLRHKMIRNGSDSDSSGPGKWTPKPPPVSK